MRINIQRKTFNMACSEYLRHLERHKLRYLLEYSHFYIFCPHSILLAHQPNKIQDSIIKMKCCEELYYSKDCIR